MKLAISALASALIFTTAAVAAPAAPVVNWSGFYAGGGGGGVGVGVGGSTQIGMFVLGIDGDIGFEQTTIKSDAYYGYTTANLGWQGTLRGKAGVVIGNSTAPGRKRFR